MHGASWLLDCFDAGLKLSIERGWLWLHESGTYIKQKARILFA
jgi:hypothetical protein